MHMHKHNTRADNVNKADKRYLAHSDYGVIVTDWNTLTDPGWQTETSQEFNLTLVNPNEFIKQ